MFPCSQVWCPNTPYLLVLSQLVCESCILCCFSWVPTWPSPSTIIIDGAPTLLTQLDCRFLSQPFCYAIFIIFLCFVSCPLVAESKRHHRRWCPNAPHPIGLSVSLSTFLLCYIHFCVLCHVPLWRSPSTIIVDSAPMLLTQLDCRFLSQLFCYPIQNYCFNYCAEYLLCKLHG